MRSFKQGFGIIAAVGALLVAGCGSTDSGKASTGAEHAETPVTPPLLSAPARDLDQPFSFNAGGAVIRPDGSVELPLDQYDAWEAQRLTARARSVLADQCLRAKGLELPDVLRNRTDFASPPATTLYGVISFDIARIYGYRQPPSSVEQENPAQGSSPNISPEVAAEYFEDRVRGKSGCIGEAREKLDETRPREAYLFVQRLRGRSQEEARQDQRVKEATARWSSCMKASGLAYNNPLEPAHDKSLLGKGLPLPSGAALPPPSPEEVTAAVTDIRCKRQTQYLETVTLVTAAYQGELIRSNQRALDDGQIQWEAQSQRAQAVLAH
ncbi:hypothetical protein ACIPYS_15780 [Kitasatospora sp. NPDC089913]|uniref:hypothetical protein n=1 Tax=Kitasatospora sp. NPDC089913 TaxID=3364080 RepID=UPI00382CE130